MQQFLVGLAIGAWLSFMCAVSILIGMEMYAKAGEPLGLVDVRERYISFVIAHLSISFGLLIFAVGSLIGVAFIELIRFKHTDDE